MTIDEIIAILKAEDSRAEQSISEEFQLKIDHVYWLIATIRKILNEKSDKLHVEDVLKAVATFHLAKSVRAVRAIVNLCRAGWGVEAQILLRALVESMITVYYIVDGGIDRAVLYVEYDHILQKNILDRALKDDEVFKIIGYREDQCQEIFDNYERVKNNYPRKDRWANESIRKMAEEVNLAFFYNYVYWMFSNMAHSNPRSSLYYLEIEDDTPKFKFGPSLEWISPCLALSSEILIRLLTKLKEIFPLEIDDDIVFLLECNSAVFGPDEFERVKHP